MSLIRQLHYVLDLDEGRLDLAKKYGADKLFKITSRDGKEVANIITNEFGQTNRTIECTGVESSIQTGIYVRNILLKENFLSLFLNFGLTFFKQKLFF